MLVELLAAIPSVILGLWGIIVMGPFLAQHVEPWLNDHLGSSHSSRATRPRSPPARLHPAHDNVRADHRKHQP